MVQVWKNHLGGVFFLDDDEDTSIYEETCEQCGDWDSWIGSFVEGDLEELKSILEDEGYSDEYIKEVLEEANND